MRRLVATLAGPIIGGGVAMCAASREKTGAWPEMGVPQPARQHKDGAVDAMLNYQHQHVDLVKSRRDLGGSDDALDGADWDRQTVVMRNGRHAQLTLEAQGFELVHDPKMLHADYYDEGSVVGRYYRECEELVKQATGAAKVFAFDHNVRCDAGKASGRRLKGGNLVQAPAGIVHGDYTAASAPRRFAQLGQQPKANDPLKAVLGEAPLLDEALVRDALSGARRFAFVNVWRPISTVEQKPLACADAASVRAEDLIVFQIVYADRVGENYFAKHAARHAWYYFPRMTRDECLLIKQWDSHGALADGGDTRRSTFALHSAFKDPSAPESAAERESIEVRCVLVF